MNVINSRCARKTYKPLKRPDYTPFRATVAILHQNAIQVIVISCVHKGLFEIDSPLLLASWLEPMTEVVVQVQCKQTVARVQTFVENLLMKKEIKWVFVMKKPQVLVAAKMRTARVATTEKDALALGRVFCDTLRGDCYRRKIKQKEYDYCRLARGQLVEGLCPFYPFAEDRTGEGTGKCLLFRFSGGLRRVPASDGASSFMREQLPGGTSCRMVKVLQTLFYPGQPERNKSIWDTVDREEQVGSPHFFSGFAEFVDGTRKYFFHEFYANAEAFWQSCSCPPEKQTFNPTTGQCE